MDVTNPFSLITPYLPPDIDVPQSLLILLVQGNLLGPLAAAAAAAAAAARSFLLTRHLSSNLEGSKFT